MITDEYFSTSRKVKLYIRYWLPECPKAFMMFIHGAGEHSGQYSHLGMECLQRQIAFIAPDVRGFGNSVGPRGHIRRFQDYLDDLDQLVVHLHARNPELPVFLMGHSFGGLIAIRYAQQFCKKIHGIILTSPALDIAPGIPKLIRKMVGLVSFVTPALPLELVKWNESFRYDPLVSPDLIERFIGNIVSHDKKLTVYADGKHQFLHNREVLQHIFQWLSVRLE